MGKIKGKLLKKFSLKIPFKTFQCARRSGRVRACASPRSCEKMLVKGFQWNLFVNDFTWGVGDRRV